MSIAFDPVRTADDRQRLAALADEIWHEYWPALIGDAQTDYMVENFQSLEAIERDMREHAYEYWFMRAEATGASRDTREDAWSPRRTASSSRRCICAPRSAARASPRGPSPSTSASAANAGWTRCISR